MRFIIVIQNHIYIHLKKLTFSLIRDFIDLRLGRALWKKWSGYHRRSLVETKMHCIKLLGDKLYSRNFDSQVNEIHARVAVLNKFTELGRPHTQVVT